MAVTYLGSLSLGQSMPLFNLALAEFLRTLLQEIANIEAEALALTADIAALEGDLAALTSDLADPQGILDAMLGHLLAGPAAYVAGIEAAIANILSGLQVESLKQALLAGPAIFMQSLEAAIAEVTSKIADIQAKIASVTGRIAGIVQRAAALAERIAALTAMQLRVGDWQGTLAAAGVHMYRFAGTVANFAGEIDSELSGGAPGGTPADVGTGIFLLATAGGAISSINAVFRP